MNCMDNAKTLIGLAGRSGNGKDLVASIIQYLTSKFPLVEAYTFQDFYSEAIAEASPFVVKKYADKLKDILCILLGCKRADLEDRVFKETELGPEWDQWEWIDKTDGLKYKSVFKPETTSSIEKLQLVKMTPRKLMQQLGTECGRQIIHPNIWINALFADFKPYSKGKALDIVNGNALEAYMHQKCANCSKAYYGYKRQIYCAECIEDENFKTFPSWIISDVRFPINEGGAVTDRGGINIGIKRRFGLRVEKYAHLEVPNKPYCIPFELKEVDNELYKALTHESEELMGDFEWCDYVIENNGTIDELIEKVKTILVKENIILI